MGTGTTPGPQEGSAVRDVDSVEGLLFQCLVDSECHVISTHAVPQETQLFTSSYLTDTEYHLPPGQAEPV